MKLENEPGFAQTSPRKSYNPFDSDNDDTDVYVKNNVNPYEISFEKNAESLPFDLENGDLSWEEAILGSPAIPAYARGEPNLLRKDTELFTDKTVTECELPELMVCYKENAYHNVKDIVIDEGVPTNGKAWNKSKDIHGVGNLSFPEAHNGDINGDLSLENEHWAQPFIQDLAEDSMKCSGLGSEDLERQNFANQSGNSVEVDEFKEDLGKKESDSSWQSEGDKKTMGAMVNDTKDHQESETDDLNHAKVEKMFLETKDDQLSKTNEVSYVKVDKNVNEFSEEEHGKDDVSLEHTKEASTKALIMDGTAAITESSENPKKEQTAPQSYELPVSQESAGISVSNILSYNSKVESGSIILDFNSSSTISAKEEEEKEKAKQNLAAEKPPESQNISVEKPPKPQTMSRHNDKAPGIDKWAHGEASFSADMPPPASIIYMGPNARCGSISLRSESSTGSTRSFAFPVLQAEWNSSPVRMAKADQRHLHKHRGWVHSLMCCRF